MTLTLELYGGVKHVGRRSKQKGNAYELKIAKELSKWWGGKFSRVPASGGLHWGSDQRVAGDIIPPVNSNFPFVVECKKREGFTLHNLFLNTGQIKEWYNQVVLDARRVNLTPILIFSKNRDKDYILIPYVEDVYFKLDKEYPVSRQTVMFDNIREETQYFDTMLTTLEGLESLDTKYVVDTYTNIDWDWQNKK